MSNSLGRIPLHASPRIVQKAELGVSFIGPELGGALVQLDGPRLVLVQSVLPVAISKAKSAHCHWIARVDSFLDHGEGLFHPICRGRPTEWTITDAALLSCQDAASAHSLHATGLEHRMMPIGRQRQRTDGTIVLLRPRAPLLHQHQLIPRGHALPAPPIALPHSSLILAVRIFGQLAFARAADQHRFGFLRTSKPQATGQV